MNIIVGASGNVGSSLVKELSEKNLPVRAVVRNAEKVTEKGVDVRIADLFSSDQLIAAFDGGTSVFLITPENPMSHDIIRETKLITDNYKKAIQKTGIRKIVALSSGGAHVNGNTGNLLMSRILEQTCDDVDGEKIIIRPSYYYSNWLAYLEAIKQSNVLPTFFPEELKIDMNSPIDVGKFIAGVMTSNTSSEDKKVFELAGPQKYSSSEVAQTFSKLLNKNIATQTMPRDQWRETLISVGFTENTASNLSDMTEAVINGTAVLENEDKAVRLKTTLYEYLAARLHQ
jgi:uncharacterized protein YbjT (DUF2867 family)